MNSTCRRISVLILTLPLMVVGGNAWAEVQASGTVTLIEATDYSGTTVVFHSDSPGAVTDSTTTDVSGHYELGVQEGAYDVEFRHGGYVTQEQLNQLITENSVLDTIDLLPTSRILNGEVAGVLGAGKEYFVEGNISVSATDSLFIEPGATLYFMGSYSLTVAGKLVAVGTEAEPVRFLSGQAVPAAADWGAIVFELDADDTSRLEHCEISHGGWSVILHLNSITLRSCTITDATYGIYMFPDSRPGNVFPLVEDCLIENMSSPGIMVGAGIYAASITRTVLRNCNKGIMVFGSTTPAHTDIIDCTVEGSSGYSIHLASACYGKISGTTVVDGGGIGIYVQDGDPEIDHCVVADNQGSGIYLRDASPTVENSVVYGNMTGLAFYNSSVEAQINSCIIDATFPLGTNPTNASNSQFFYNCLVGSDEFFPTNVGVPVMTNANGDPCDIYYNICMDHQMADPENSDYSLQPTSPCIDAGSPLLPLDPDGTTSDMGATYFDQELIGVPSLHVPVSLRVAPNYPNPFNPSTAIEFAMDKDVRVRVQVHDVAGRLVRELIAGRVMTAGTHTVTWDGRDSAGRTVSSGVYLFIVATEDELISRSMTLLK